LGCIHAFQPPVQKSPDFFADLFNLFNDAGGDQLFHVRCNPDHGVYRFYHFFIPGTQTNTDIKMAIVLGINHSVFNIPHPGASGINNSDNFFTHYFYGV
jgi:hypothetical protein